MGIAVDTTALNVIWWGPQLTFPQSRGKILRSAGKQLLTREHALWSRCLAHHCSEEVPFSKDFEAKANLESQGVPQDWVKTRQAPSCTTEEQSTQTTPGAVGLLFLLSKHQCLLSLGGSRNKNIINMHTPPQIPCLGGLTS